MQKNGKKQRDWHDAATRWLIFFGVAIVLSVMLWLGWSLTNRRNPIPVFGTLTTDSTVSIGLRDAPESLDIRTQQGHAVEQALLGNVYETLVSRSETNKLQPGLASSWQISDDGLTYTFTLRSGVKFSNGHSLDSADAVWSLQNAVNNHYVDADQLDGLQQVDNPDAHTLVITLSKPNPRLLRALSGRAGIVYDEESDNDYAKTAVGSGPFTVARASKSEIVLQRNDSYWGTKAASSQITLYYYSSESSLTSAMEGGKISMALPLSADAAETLNATRGISADSGISFDKVMLAFNNANESILVDQQMRKVMRYAIDARSIAKTANDSYGTLGGPISPLEDGYEDLTELFPHDLTQAQQLRSYFGTGYIGTIDLLIPQQYETIGNTVKEQIEQLGVSVNMEVLDSATSHGTAYQRRQLQYRAHHRERRKRCFRIHRRSIAYSISKTVMPASLFGCARSDERRRLSGKNAHLCAHRQRERGLRLAVHAQELHGGFRPAAGISEESDRPSVAAEQGRIALIFP